MNNKNKNIAKGLSVQTIISLTLGALDIISFSIMSRLLTPKDFGYFAAIVAVSSIFSALADTGVGAAIVQKKNANKEYINNAFTICFLSGLIVSGVLFLSAGFLADIFVDSSLTLALRIFSVSIFFQCLTSVNLSILQKKYKFVKMGMANIFSLIATTIFAIILAIFGFGYYSIIAKVVTASFLTFVISMYFAQEKYSFSYNRMVAKEILGYGGWLMLSAVFRNLAHQVDRLLMPRLLSIEILGAYTRPKEFMYSITQKINGILDTVIFPHLSEIHDENEKLKKSFLLAIYLFGVLGLALSFMFIINSKLLIFIFFGEEWLHVDILFKLLSIYPVFLFWGRMGDIFLRSMGLTKNQFYLRISQLVLSVVAVIVSYRKGVEWVAVTIIISYVIVMIIKTLFIANKIYVNYKMVFLTAIRTFKMSIIYVPMITISILFLPDTFTGCLIQLGIYIISTILMFLVFPRCIGNEYNNIITPFIIDLKKRMYKKRIIN